MCKSIICSSRMNLLTLLKLIDKPAFEKVEEEVQVSNNEYVAKSMWNKNTAMILIASAGFILAINSIVGGD